MKVYTCKTFEGHWPVGSAAVVVAPNQDRAAEILNTVLMEDHALKGDAEPIDMVFLCHAQRNEDETVRVLLDGDY